MKDKSSKAIWSNPVPCKGTEDPYALQIILKNLDETGYKKVILKSDQEPAIKALVEAAKIGWSQKRMMEKAPKGESKSNREVERAVQEVQGIARTLKEALEQESSKS